MPKVRVIFLGALRELFGRRENVIYIEGKTVRHLLQILLKLPEKDLNSSIDAILKQFEILINGRSASLLKGLETELKDEDTVIFFPPAVGG